MKNTISLFLLLCFLFQGGIKAQTPERKLLKIISFNIRMSGEKTGYQPQPFADFISEQQPDLVALQEVDYKVSRSGNKDFLTELAALTGMFPIFAKAIDTGGGEYGVGILSKYPVGSSEVEALPFPSGAKEKRVALICHITFPDNFDMKFISTHLDHSSEAVRSEMVQGLNSKNILSGNNPVIVCGDFNAKPFESTIAVGMKRWKPVGDNTNTYPSDNPSSKIDYIFAYPVAKWETVRYEVLPLPISDHCALVSEVQFSK